MAGSLAALQTVRTTESFFVYVISKSPERTQAVLQILAKSGYATEVVDSADGLCDAVQAERAGCIVTIREAGDCCIEALLQTMKARAGIRLPVVVLGRNSRLSDAVACMRQGAMDFLEEPFDPGRLIDAVRSAISSDRERADRESAAQAAARRLRLLTDREREMAGLVASGLSTKQIALRLQLSQKTVSNHRAHILAKTAVENTAALVKLVVTAQTLERDNRLTWRNAAIMA